MALENLGWNSFFETAFESFKTQGFQAGRVSSQFQKYYHVLDLNGKELLGEVTGKFRHDAKYPADFPAVGDWVVIKPMPGENKVMIHAVLPRKSKFSRKVAGDEMEEQLIATNIDTVFLVQSLDANFNLRRLERYLALAMDSGADTTIILHKADLNQESASKRSEVEKLMPTIPTFVTSKMDMESISEIKKYLVPGKTYALLGSSGVGKSTLVNLLSGQNQQHTAEVREADSRGRHTTTNRELLVLENGAILIDTPGMRELQLWEAETGIDETFQDILDLSAQCKFRNCKHKDEPGCMVKEALSSGRLDYGRLANYLKMQKELAYLESKQNPKTKREREEKSKSANKQLYKKLKDKYGN